MAPRTIGTMHSGSVACSDTPTLWFEDDVIVMSYLSGLVNQDCLEDKLGETRISGSDTRTTDYISILRKQRVKVGNKRVKVRN